jgi:DNA-binding ferritin-like protein
MRELYGYHPPSITSSLKEKSKVQAVEDDIENQQQVLQIIRDNLTIAHNHNETTSKSTS